MFDFLFGKTKDQYDNEYNKAIKDAKQAKADSAYDFYYNKALYDANKDYFDKAGVKDPATETWLNADGKMVNALANSENLYGNYIKDLEKEREEVAKKNKYNIYGDGLFGAFLNPIHQSGTAIQDLVTSGTSEWDKGNRDVWSDVGAMGESALTLLPVAGAGVKGLKGAMGLAKGADAVNKAGKLAKATNAIKGVASAHPLATKVTGSALGMGGWSGLGALRDYGSDIGNHLPETALQVGIGAGLGAATAGAGYGLKKLWNKYTAPVPSSATDVIRYTGGANTNNPKYQEALKTLGITGDNLTEEGLKEARNQATKNLAKTMGYESAEGQAGRTAINNAYQDLLDVLNGKGGAEAVYTAPQQSLGQKFKNIGGNVKRDLTNSKAGVKLSNLLKTKKGKVLAGAGGGLLLAQLMRSRGQNNNLSDEELNELYNYVYGGGQ